MKHLATILMLSGLAFASIAFAQTPASFKYQAIARDGTGAILSNKNISFRISIQQGTVTGAYVYSERHYTVTNEFGLVNLEIGKGTVGTGSISGINWGIDNFFLKIEMDPMGGESYILMGTSQLLSVPYALHAKTVEKGDNWGSQSAFTDLTLAGNGTLGNPLKISQQMATTGNVLKWNGSAWLPSLDAVGNSYWDAAGKNIFYSTGNVGIGTDRPLAPLHIEFDTDMNTPHLLLDETDSDYARLMFRNTKAPMKNWTIAGKGDVTDSNSRLNFYYATGASAGTNLLSITGNGEVQQAKTGEANMLPIAYGYIKADGTAASGTGNFTSTFNYTTRSYEIVINGESYYFRDYTTIVTPWGSNPIIALTGSIQPKLLVTLHDLTGAKVQGEFQFVTYKD